MKAFRRRKALGRRLLLALAFGALAAPAPAAAASRDVMCSVVLKLEGGGFSYRPEPGLSVLRLARAEGPFAYDNPGDVVGFSCLRTELVPDEADLEILQAGYDLYIAGQRNGMLILELSLADGRVKAEMDGGALNPAEQRRLDRVVGEMQARLSERR